MEVDLYKKLKEFGKVKLKESLAKHTTYKIGGPADYFVIAEGTDKLVGLLQFLDGEGIEYFILGGGSNILFSDDGYRGVVVKIINHKSKIINEVVECGAGCTMAKVVSESLAADLTGLEWAVGLPGTIGGAVRGNAAYGGKYTADVVDKVEVYRDGEILVLKNKDCEFANKESIFKHNNDIILRVWFKLKKITSEAEKISSKKEMMEQIKYRTKSQPSGFASAGCVFKNYEVADKAKAKFREIIKEERILEILEKYNKIPVGWMIEQVGMKGEQVGDAKVSEEHANFIINLGAATAQDVLTLIAKIKEKVYNKFGIEIEEEIQIL